VASTGAISFVHRATRHSLTKPYELATALAIARVRTNAEPLGERANELSSIVMPRSAAAWPSIWNFRGLPQSASLLRNDKETYARELSIGAKSALSRSYERERVD
jgi:hypothetical protein